MIDDIFPQTSRYISEKVTIIKIFGRILQFAWLGVLLIMAFIKTKNVDLPLMVRTLFMAAVIGQVVISLLYIFSDLADVNFMKFIFSLLKCGMNILIELLIIKQRLPFQAGYLSYIDVTAFIHSIFVLGSIIGFIVFVVGSSILSEIDYRLNIDSKYLVGNAFKAIFTGRRRR